MIRYAWPAFENHWTLEVRRVSIDGETATDVVDGPRHRVRLDHADDWQQADLSIAVHTSELPEQVTPGGAVAIVSSRSTNTRTPFVLEPGEDQNSFSGDVFLSRSAISGATDLSVTIWGHVAGRPRSVASSDPWTIIADPSAAPTPPGKPPFETAWISFADPASPEVARFNKDAYAVLDLASELKPTLLMNKDIAGLDALILPETARGERRRIRAIIGTAIARDATAALVRAAAAEVVDIDEDADPQPPSDALQRQACEAVAGAMYSTSSATELYDRLVEANRGSFADRARLWTEIDAAIDSLTKHSSSVRNVVEAVRHA